MSGNMDPDFVESRKRGLEQYLQDVVADPNALGSPEFRSFMDANRAHSVRLSEDLAAPSGTAAPSGSTAGVSTGKARLQRKVSADDLGDVRVRVCACSARIVILAALAAACCAPAAITPCKDSTSPARWGV
jgi:hypothetical protein